MDFRRPTTKTTPRRSSALLKVASLQVVLICLLSTAGVQAQEDYEFGYDFLPAEDQLKEGRTVLFTLKHIRVVQLRAALGLTNADIEIDPGLNLIAARSPDEEELETIRRIVETLDVAPEPQPTIELTAYVLASSVSPVTSKTASSRAKAPAAPEELAEEIEALRSRFDVDSLRLLDTIFLRVGGGSGGQVEGSFPSWGVQGLSGYQFQFDGATVSNRPEKEVVHLEGLTFIVTGENPAGVQRAVLRTDVDIDVGDQAMVGKATPRGVDDTLILLVAAEVRKP